MYCFIQVFGFQVQVVDVGYFIDQQIDQYVFGGSIFEVFVGIGWDFVDVLVVVVQLFDLLGQYGVGFVFDQVWWYFY